MSIRSAATMAGLAFGLMAGTAQAAILNFNYTGSSTVSFSLDEMPTPDYSNADLTEFSNVATIVDGSATSAQVDFYAGDYGGGFSVLKQNYYLDVFGDLVFSGSTDNPTFSPGVFVVQEKGGIGGILTISTVPLPASAPMFGAALVALGAVGYGVKRKGKVASAA